MYCQILTLKGLIFITLCIQDCLPRNVHALMYIVHNSFKAC